MTRLLHEYKDTLLSSVVLRSQVEVSLSESAAIPFIQFLVCSSSPIFRNSMSALVVLKNSLLYRSYGRLAKGGGGTNIKTGMDTLLYFY